MFIEDDTIIFIVLFLLILGFLFLQTIGLIVLLFSVKNKINFLEKKINLLLKPETTTSSHQTETQQKAKEVIKTTADNASSVHSKTNLDFSQNSVLKETTFSVIDPIKKAENKIEKTSEIISEKKEKIVATKSSQEPSEIEKRSMEILKKMWNWFIVGEENQTLKVSREYAIATTWLLRGSILLIVFGIAYFVKYSHDHNLLPIELRLSIAASFTMGMIIYGYYLLKGHYKIFGYSLIGGGFAGLYMVVFAASGIYKLFSPSIGLGLLTFLTIGGITLALRLNTMYLAIIAIIGGYISPILLSTGSRNLTALYIYMIILSLGVLIANYYHSWRILNLLAFLITWIIYAGSTPFKGDYGYFEAILFGLLFFILFSIIPIIHAFFKRQKISIIELLIIGCNFFFCLGTILPSMSKYYGREAAGILILSLAFYYAIQLILMLKCKIEDRSLLLSYLISAVSLLSLSVPFMLNANYYGIAWGIQAIALLYLGARVQSPFMKKLSYPLFFIAAYRLFLVDYVNYYHVMDLSNFINRLINLGGFSLILLLSYFILRKNNQTLSLQATDQLPKKDSISSQIMLWSMLFFSYIFILGEFNHLHSQYYLYSNLGIVIFSALYLYLIVLIYRRYQQIWIVILSIFALLGLTGFSLLLISNMGAFHPFNSILKTTQFLFLTGFLIACGLTIRPLHKSHTRSNLFLGLAGIIWFYYSSNELSHAMTYYYSDGEALAVSSLWGIYALFMLAGGILKQQKVFRIIGLTLFAIAISKILLIDLAETPLLWRVGGCLLTGIIMMIGAWFYARFKKRFENNETV